METASPAPVLLHTRYEVVSGDTLSGIAQDHAISLEELLADNPIDDPRKLEIGRVLRIPVPRSQVAGSEPEVASEPRTARAEPVDTSEIASLLERAQGMSQDGQYTAALETLVRAEAAAVSLPEGEASRSVRAQVALMAATVELSRGDDAGAVQRFAQVLGLIPYYVPEPGVFSPHALELLEQARSGVGFTR